MTWRIITTDTSVEDARQDITYRHRELDGAKFICANDLGEVCFHLRDKRIAWLISADLEVVYPLQDDHIRKHPERTEATV